MNLRCDTLSLLERDGRGGVEAQSESLPREQVDWKTYRNLAHLLAFSRLVDAVDVADVVVAVVGMIDVHHWPQQRELPLLLLAIGLRLIQIPSEVLARVYVCVSPLLEVVVTSRSTPAVEATRYAIPRSWPGV